jgi:drug/metabolite transporter (DMT)-like permease
VGQISLRFFADEADPISPAEIRHAPEITSKARTCSSHFRCRDAHGMKHETLTSFIAVLGFLFYSAGDAGIKLGSAGYSSLQVGVTVMFFGFLPTLLHMWQQDVLRDPLPKNPKLMFLLFCVKAGQIPCLFYAFANMPLALVYAAMFASPLVTSAMGVAILGEQTGPRRIAAICAGFVGVLIAINPSSIDLEFGHLALIALPVLGAAGNIIVRISGPQEALSIMSFWPNLGVIVLMVLAGGSSFEPMEYDALFILMAVAFCSWLGGVVFIHAMRRGPTISAISMQYSQVIWGGLLGYFLFKEAVTWPTILGSAVIVVSGLYIMFRAEDRSVAPASDDPSVQSKVAS